MKFAEKLRAFFGGQSAEQKEFFESLADLLIEGDFGAALAMETVDKLEAVCRKEKITGPEEVKARLAVILKEYLPEAAAPSQPEERFKVILLLGVNGVGKTTTAAKLAFYYMRDARGGKQSGGSAVKPLLAAADTFRAAAIEQLEIHGKNLGVRVVAHKQGGDAAAVVFDALQAARAGAYNPVIADTAGRMHTKTALLEELKKIDRVVERFAAAGPEGAAGGVTYLKYLCLDATTGTNALVQAETFNEAVRLDGVILTKLDSTARGGVIFPLAVKLGLPVVFVGSGERYENFAPFNAGSFLSEFLAG